MASLHFAALVGPVCLRSVHLSARVSTHPHDNYQGKIILQRAYLFLKMLQKP